MGVSNGGKETTEKLHHNNIIKEPLKSSTEESYISKAKGPISSARTMSTPRKQHGYLPPPPPPSLKRQC